MLYCNIFNEKAQMEIKQCIQMSTAQYTAIIKKIFGDKASVDFNCSGVTVEYEMDDGEWKEEDRTNVCKKLAEYFDVSTVTSVELADCECTGVRIFFDMDYAL